MPHMRSNPIPSTKRTARRSRLGAKTLFFAALLMLAAVGISTTVMTGVIPSAIANAQGKAAGADKQTKRGKGGVDQNRTEVQQFFQGFETDNVWDTTGTITNPTRVASGTNGVTSKTGGFHAEVNTQVTDWGGYNSTFPALGYVTSVDIYLNVAGGFANDTRFDWDAASNKVDGNHLRDFAFNAGFYTDAIGPGAGLPRFVVSASNNTGRANSYPKNPGRAPIAITDSGWYTFQHYFHDNGSGALAVDLSIINSNGATLSTWTLSNVADTIPTVVGGNRYGWMAQNEFSFLAVDNAYRANVGAAATEVVTQLDLTNTPNYTDWFFYQDSSVPPYTETIDNALGTMVPGPGTPPLGIGGAQISTTGQSRPNLATYQFAGTVLADINELKFSTYNPSAGNGGAADRSGYLNFNVDFNGSDTWQRRLVYLPRDNGAVVQDSWQEWDAINGGNAKWQYSGPTWPAGVGGGGEPGTTTKTWNQILNQYPGIKMRTTDSWLGIRVGEPYTDGYTENIDKFVFGTSSATKIFDFEPAPIMVDDDGQASITDCDAPDAANSTIQAGINAALAGGLVKVCPGTYTESPQIAKSVTVQSTGGRDVTTIQLLPSGTPGTGYLAGVNIDSTTADVVIDGFTIIGNDAANPVLANSNVYVNNAASVTLTNSRIKVGARDSGTNNDDGIGVLTSYNVSAGTVTITNNEFMPVNASGGRAFYINPGVGTTVNIQNNQVTGHFTGNAATECGGPISNNTFTGTGASGGLGAYYLGGPVCGDPGPFTNNTVSGATAGILIYGANNTVLTGNAFVGNGMGIRIQAVDVTGTVAHFNRIANNTTAGFTNDTASVVDAENNWWGCNYGPGASGAGCPVAANGITGSGAGSVDANPWLVLTTSATPPSGPIGGNSTIASAINTNSNSGPAGGNVPDGTPATFAGVLGSVAPAAGTTASGLVGTIYTSISGGVGSASTTVDGQTVSATYTAAACGGPSATVTTDNATSKTGVPKTIPINTTTLTGLGQDVISADITFNYDPSVISYVSTSPGTVLPGGTTINVNNPVPGTLIISVYANGPASPFTGAGTLVDLNFNVIGPIGSSSPLQLTNFWYNGTLVCSNVSSGTLTIISGEVSGKVTYAHQPGVKPVPGALLNAPGSPNVSDTTDSNGDYTLSGFGPGAYTVTPSKANKLTAGDPGYPPAGPNGIFSNDPSLISMHIVGITPISDPVQLNAAWVSEGTTPFLSSFDAALIAQWIVGIHNPLNLTGQWKFTPASTVYPNLIGDYSGQNYLALLKGDVNGDWSPLGSNRPAPMTKEQARNAVRVSLPELTAAKGAAVIVPFRLDNLRGAGITSYQFDVEYDPGVLSPSKVAADIAGTMSSGLTVVSNSPQPGLLKVVVYGAWPAVGDGVYLNLRFRPRGEVGSSSPLTITGFRFNDGKTGSVTTDGRITITEPNRTER